MPVTKKKGAIFEIYADSPRPAAETKHRRPLPSRSAGAGAGSSVATAAPASPSPGPISAASAACGTKRPSTRRVLADLPTTRSFGAASASVTKPPSTRPSAASTKLAVLADKTPQLSEPRPRASSSKAAPARKMHVFVDAHEGGGENASMNTSSKATASSSSQPLKRRPLGTMSSSTAPRSAPLCSAPSLRTSAPTTTASSSRRAFDIFTDPTPSAAPPVSRKRERVVSRTDKENTGGLPDSPASNTRSKSRTSTRSLGGSSAALSGVPGTKAGSAVLKATAADSGKLPLSAKRRFGVQPLADVSLAYEASGGEPVGFRDQGLGASRRGLRNLDSR